MTTANLTPYDRLPEHPVRTAGSRPATLAAALVVCSAALAGQLVAHSWLAGLGALSLVGLGACALAMPTLLVVLVVPAFAPLAERLLSPPAAPSAAPHPSAPSSGTAVKVPARRAHPARPAAHHADRVPA